jgi:hypothetical protein
VSPPKIEVRDALEIQHAHDTLLALITGALPKLAIDPETRSRIMITCDVLCWVLKHDHNQAFAENLAGLREQIREAGYREHQLPYPMTGGVQGPVQ